jgi:hypothetical protein
MPSFPCVFNSYPRQVQSKSMVFLETYLSKTMEGTHSLTSFSNFSA